jgi:hypothetical protein
LELQSVKTTLLPDGILFISKNVTEQTMKFSKHWNRTGMRFSCCDEASSVSTSILFPVVSRRLFRIQSTEKDDFTSEDSTSLEPSLLPPLL